MRVPASVLGLIVTILLAASGAAGPDNVQGRFERTLSVSGPVQLQVSTGAGAITVHSGDSHAVGVHIQYQPKGSESFAAAQKGGSGTVHIRGEIRADRAYAAEVHEIEQNPPIRQTGNIITIGNEVRTWEHVGISYDITVPGATQVGAHTGSGVIAVYDVKGPLDAATGSGAIRAENIGARVNAKTGSGTISVSRAGGEVHASTGSGSIELTEVKGSAEGQTGSGSIGVSGATGRVRAHTGSGGVRVAKAASDVDAQTASGGIDVDGKPKSARWDLRTTSGSVTVSLPQGTGFEVDAHAHSGRISTTHQLTKTEVSDKRELRGIVGQPDNRIYIRTTNGSILID
jgi:hypothetical protein